MKAIINVESFQRAYNSVQSVVPSRSPKPILQNVKAVFGAESYLIATDLEVGIRHDLWGEKVDEPGEVLLPGTFGQILATTSDGELTITSDGDNIQIRGLRSEFVLPASNVAEFPDVPSQIPAAYYAVLSGDIKKAIRRTVFATDVESTRYALGGLLLEFDGGTLSTVGTDGRRLAKQSVSLEQVDTPTTHRSPVIPVKALKLIDRNLPEGSAEVRLAFVSEAVMIRTEHASIYSRLVEGRFPRYQDVFPAKPETKIVVAAPALLAVVQQAAIVTAEESRGVDLEFGKGSLKLSSSAADRGKSKISLEIDYDGPAITIAVDPRYVVDALRAIGDQPVTVELIDGKSAAVLRTDDGYCYVVMPLSRE